MAFPAPTPGLQAPDRQPRLSARALPRSAINRVSFLLICSLLAECCEYSYSLCGTKSSQAGAAPPDSSTQPISTFAVWKRCLNVSGSSLLFSPSSGHFQPSYHLNVRQDLEDPGVAVAHELYGSDTESFHLEDAYLPHSRKANIRNTGLIGGLVRGDR